LFRSVLVLLNLQTKTGATTMGNKTEEKILFAFLVVTILALVRVSCIANAGDPPPPDPGRPLYQNAVPGLWVAPGVRIGGSWHEKAWPKPPVRNMAQLKLQHEAELARIDEENKATTLRRGLAAITLGGLLFVVALVAHLSFREIPFVHNILEGGMYGGGALTAFGLWLWALVEYYHYAVLAIAVVGFGALGWLAYRLKRRGI
jgi:hypothetical protein